VAEDVKILSEMIGSGSAFILAKLHIQDPMKLVSNGLMAAFGFQKLSGRHAAAAVNEIMGLL